MHLISLAYTTRARYTSYHTALCVQAENSLAARLSDRIQFVEVERATDRRTRVDVWSISVKANEKNKKRKKKIVKTLAHKSLLHAHVCT